eukprot:4726918-Pleurochrysis_carterae.AAC.1
MPFSRPSVVMTTNHPEQLDPALIRPGRINKKMLLGYLHLAQAEKMVEHYFGTLTNEQRSRLASMFTPNVFTPAQVRHTPRRRYLGLSFVPFRVDGKARVDF